jgi:conjugative relaxase-like TrwC/TraI family protein
MSISHKKSKSGSYYITCMTIAELKQKGFRRPRVDDYYTSAGNKTRDSEDVSKSTAKEPPGIWYVAPRPKTGGTKVGKEQRQEDRKCLGLVDGKVFDEHDPDRFSNMCSGYHPEGDLALVQNAGKPNHIALHDFTFSACKSISVIWSQSNPVLKCAIEKLHRLSVREAMDFFSEMGAYTRRGHGSKVLEKTSFIACIFQHGSSRADDPQLHEHAVVINLCMREDGTYGAIETFPAMKWQGAVASIYHAGLAFRMRLLGAAILMDGKIPEIDGVPPEVIEAFSRRHKQIKEAVEKAQEEHGLNPDIKRASRALVQKYTIETRDDKSESSREELDVEWVKRGKALGFTEREVREVINLGEPAEVFDDKKLLAEAGVALANIMEMNATFRLPALYTAIAVHLCGRANLADIRTAVDLVLPELVQARKLINTETGETEVVYSTKEMLGLERELVELAKLKTPRHMMTPEFVKKSIFKWNHEVTESARKIVATNGGSPEDVKGFEVEQCNAIRHACRSENQVSVVEGTAGSGKTFVAKFIVRMYKEQNYTVHGLAGAWAQALNLQYEAGLDTGRAIAGWLEEVKQGKIVLTSKDVIIVDEVGMIGVRNMRDVLRVIRDAGAKAILLGDTLQQSSVSAGDALRVIVGQTGSVRLDNIRRQSSEIDKAAVPEFFAGKAAQALDRYKNRTHYSEGSDTTTNAIIGDWMKSRIAHIGKSHLILTFTNPEVVEINRAAQLARRNAGELGMNSVSLITMDSTDKKAKKINDRKDLFEFTEKDRVVFRKNNRGLSVVDKDAKKTLKEYDRAVRFLKGLGVPREQDIFMKRMNAYFKAEGSGLSQEIADRVSQQISAGGDKPGLSLRAHHEALSERARDTERLKASDVYNRIRGVIESINPSTGVMKISTEDGKIVTFDPKDEKWMHKSGGLGIQHDYAATINASQGLTRDFVFIKDSPLMDRRQAGVAFSRHRDDCHVYVDREARFENMKRNVVVEDWGTLKEFSDNDCFDQMKDTYSRDRGKESTLDYDDWKESDGTPLFPHDDLALDNINRIRENWSTLLASDTGQQVLPFQKLPTYALAPYPDLDFVAIIFAVDRLYADGMKRDVVREFQRQGVITLHRDGEPSVNGYWMNPETQERILVNRIRNGVAESGAMRDRFPPVVVGQDAGKTVHIVRSVEDAMALWSHCDRTNQRRPTVIIAHGNLREATCLPHIRAILAASTTPPVLHPGTSMTAYQVGAAKRNLMIAGKRDEIVMSGDPLLLNDTEEIEKSLGETANASLATVRDRHPPRKYVPD